MKGKHKQNSFGMTTLDHHGSVKLCWKTSWECLPSNFPTTMKEEYQLSHKNHLLILLGLFILDVSQNEGFIFVSFLGGIVIVFMLSECDHFSPVFHQNGKKVPGHKFFLPSLTCTFSVAIGEGQSEQRLKDTSIACQLGGYWLCMDDLLGSHLGTIGGNINSVWQKTLSLSTGYNSIWY